MRLEVVPHGDDDAHVQEFAASLVRTLGREEAVWVCRSNSWDGVLRIIEPPMPYGQTKRVAH